VSADEVGIMTGVRAISPAISTTIYYHSSHSPITIATITNKQSLKFFVYQYPSCHDTSLPHKQKTKSPDTYPNISNINTMEDVNIPSDNVPAELKACEQILKRAKELKKAEPVVAYWCKLPPFFYIKADK
jgi:hypothetical protein